MVSFNVHIATYSPNMGLGKDMAYIKDTGQHFPSHISYSKVLSALISFSRWS